MPFDSFVTHFDSFLSKIIMYCTVANYVYIGKAQAQARQEKTQNINLTLSLKYKLGK